MTKGSFKLPAVRSMYFWPLRRQAEVQRTCSCADPDSARAGFELWTLSGHLGRDNQNWSGGWPETKQDWLDDVTLLYIHFIYLRSFHYLLVNMILENMVQLQVLCIGLLFKSSVDLTLFFWSGLGLGGGEPTKKHLVLGCLLYFNFPNQNCKCRL